MMSVSSMKGGTRPLRGKVPGGFFRSYATETGSESTDSLMSFSFGEVRTIREYWAV